MEILTRSDLVRELRQWRLLDEAQLGEVVREFAHISDARSLASQLLERDLLTPYQINQLFTRKNPELLLGPYHILGRLGEGGMGQVFKARHARIDRAVAVKVLRRNWVGHAAAGERFQREIEALAQLNHPNIVQALDAGEVNGAPFVVMEFVPGINLTQLVKRQGPLRIQAACEYIRQAALGLQHAYEHGLVHRDIKPSNLMLTYTRRALGESSSVTAVDEMTYSTSAFERVKVLDLGLARLASPDGADEVGELTQAGTVVGSPDFMSPEQARDARRADVRSDLYSLGCTLFYLLTGDVPFPGGTTVARLFAHAQQTPPLVRSRRPDIPAWLEVVLQRLLAKHPDDRYQTPAELVAELEGRGGEQSLVGERRRVTLPSASIPTLSEATDTPTEGCPFAFDMTAPVVKSCHGCRSGASQCRFSRWTGALVSVGRKLLRRNQEGG